MVQKTVLENGIRVVTEQIPTAHSVTVGIWVGTGSRHETPAENGISHLVEHMLFKGTERRSARDIAREIDSVGGVLNAFTSREFSCYYSKILAKKLPLAIDLLGDIILNSVFDLDELEKERRVILQEIFMTEDSPDDKIHDLFNTHFWRDHSLGYPILGTRETVSSLTRQNLVDFMSRRYCGRNLLICAAGNLEHQELLDLVMPVFGELYSGENPSLLVQPDYGRSLSVVSRELEQAHLCIGTRALAQNHPNRFSAYILNTILGGSMSSRLVQKIREDRGLSYSIYSYLNCHSDCGALCVYAGTSPEDSAEVVDTVLAEFRRFRDQEVPEEEINAALEQLKANLLLSLESTDNRMTRLAKNEIYLGVNPSIREVLHGFEQVSGAAVQKLAEFILRDEYLNLQVLGNVQESIFPSLDLTLS